VSDNVHVQVERQGDTRNSTSTKILKGHVRDRDYHRLMVNDLWIAKGPLIRMPGRATSSWPHLV
jgi:hypothetical protein